MSSVESVAGVKESVRPRVRCGGWKGWLCARARARGLGAASITKSKTSESFISRPVRARRATARPLRASLTRAKSLDPRTLDKTRTRNLPGPHCPSSPGACAETCRRLPAPRACSPTAGPRARTPCQPPPQLRAHRRCARTGPRKICGGTGQLRGNISSKSFYFAFVLIARHAPRREGPGGRAGTCSSGLSRTPLSPLCAQLP
jgi:hypothetical protein